MTFILNKNMRILIVILMLQLFTCLSLQARSVEVVYKTVDSLQMKLYIDYPDDMKASEKRPAIVCFILEEDG